MASALNHATLIWYYFQPIPANATPEVVLQVGRVALELLVADIRGSGYEPVGKSRLRITPGALSPFADVSPPPPAWVASVSARRSEPISAPRMPLPVLSDAAALLYEHLPVMLELLDRPHVDHFDRWSRIRTQLVEAFADYGFDHDEAGIVYDMLVAFAVHLRDQ